MGPNRRRVICRFFSSPGSTPIYTPSAESNWVFRSLVSSAAVDFEIDIARVMNDSRSTDIVELPFYHISTSLNDRRAHQRRS
jgi:hypothetical protein